MIFVCLALVWLAGFSLLRFLFRAPLVWSLHNVFVGSVGAGVGIGIASCLYFVTLALVGPNPVVITLVEAVALLGFLLLGNLVKSHNKALQWADGPAPPTYLTALFGLAIAAAAAIFIFYMLNKPHGEWDAWSIWNLRARFLYRGGDSWRDAFSTQIAWSHPDYPLLVPGIVALLWTLARVESAAASAGVAFLFTLGTAGTLISAIGILRGRMQAFIAGALLLGTVGFVEVGATQYADVPLCFYVLATLALLALQDRDPANLRYTVLAGLTAGLAAWTKNEGLLFVVAVIAARAIAVLRFGNRATFPRQLGSLAAGVALPLAVVAFFKLRFAPSNDLIAKKPGEIVAHFTDPSRWIWTFEGFVRGGFIFGSFLLPIVLILAVYWYLVRFHVSGQDRLPVSTVGMTLALMFAGDFMVYVLFSNDVVWQINTSIDRILLQMWPAGLFAFFLAANIPQLAAKTEPVSKSKPAKRARRAAS